MMGCRYLILLVLSLISTSIYGLVTDSDQDQNQNQPLKWHVITERNLSSQILLHPHLLLLVTVPWSGEARTLMKKVADTASYKLEKLDNLRLMVMYKDKDTMLADSLGVIEETTIFFYYHAVSYKYQGRLRAQNIISSVGYIISSQPEDVPLKFLHTSKDLDMFLKSTDKAVLLSEFCGWTHRLLRQWKKNETESNTRVEDASDIGIISGANFYGEAYLNLSSSRNEIEKGMNKEKLTCGINNGLGQIPWVGRFTMDNHSAPLETENVLPDADPLCTVNEFQQFGSFFTKFMASTREVFLPPERQSFGLISERSLLSFLGVRDPDAWFVMIHFAGCSNCSKILKGGDDIRAALGKHQLFVTELERDGNDVEPALLANKPSVILFVDRSSELLNTRRKSKEALETFREFASQNQLSQPMTVKDGVTPRKISDHALRRKKGGRAFDLSKDSRKDSSQLTGLDNFKNKMSLMIINEDGNIALDAHGKGRSAQDILAHLLGQRNEAKFSVVAKEVGFQLLSDDFELKLAELLQPQTEKSKSDKGISEDSTQENGEGGPNLGEEKRLNDASATPLESGDTTRVSDLESSNSKEGKITYIVKDTQSTSSVPDKTAFVSSLGVAQDQVEVKSSPQLDELEKKQPHHGNFMGFYFSDGGYHLLNSLTSRSEVPSLIIIDPISEQHFVYPEKEAFSYDSLQRFFKSFLNGSLVPYQRSESVILSPRESTRPPFINLDFHEMDPIPRVTAHTFSELVLGFNQSENKNVAYSWNKDVLVLFSNNWCGFCQRMELVVREVYRAFKGYLNLLKSEDCNNDSPFNIDIIEDVKLTKLPLFFLMDCTLNDCRSLLKSLGQRELYPSLLLFPARRKTGVSYQGDMSVVNVIKFLIDHGSNSRHLTWAKGILWTEKEEGEKVVQVEDLSPTSIQSEENSVAKEEYHEVILNDRKLPRSIELPTSIGLNEGTANVVVGSVLKATDKLINAPLFGKSIVLIVRANESTGFQGLIINKHIRWESIEDIQNSLESVRQAPLSLGGPLIANGMPFVSLTRRAIREGLLEVLPTIYFLDQLTTVEEIEGFKSGDKSTADYWFFFGYSGWGWEQLFAEIAEGAWEISDDPIKEFNWPGS